MPNAFLYGVGGKTATLAELSVSANGTYNASDYNVDGFSVVNVSVQGSSSSALEDGDLYLRGLLQNAVISSVASGVNSITIFDVGLGRLEYYGSVPINFGTKWVGSDKPDIYNLTEIYAPNLMSFPTVSTTQHIITSVVIKSGYPTSIGSDGDDYCLYNYSKLDFSNVTSCRSAILYNTRNCTMFSFPKLNYSSYFSQWGQNNRIINLNLGIITISSIPWSTSASYAGTYFSCLISLTLNSCTRISGSFSDTLLQKLELPNVTSFSINFSNNKCLSKLSLPECLSVFVNHAYPMELYAPKATSLAIGGCMVHPNSLDNVLNLSFYSKILSTEVIASSCTYLNLALASYIERISTPVLSSVFISGALSNFNDINLSNAQSVAIIYCHNLYSLSLDSCTNLRCSNNYKLTNITLGICSNLSGNAFLGCSNLKSITLLSSSVCTIQSNTFSNTPIVTSSLCGEYGSVYVPASLLEDYKVATNWVSISNRLVAIV